MTLAEAIRKGAMQRPQAFEVYVGKGSSSTCAVGAAFEGITGSIAPTIGDDEILEAMAQAGIGVEPRQPCPECGHLTLDASGPLGILVTIFHLNDDHHWTREQIADWLDARDSSPVEGA